MSRNFYIADTHFGHKNCIRYDNRPFKTIEEHDDVLIMNWNKTVAPSDHVYVIGDFAYRNRRGVKEYIDVLNGHIHLIRGNHDKRSAGYERNFESVHDVLVLDDAFRGETRKVVLCHYWMPFAPYQRRGAFVLYGHTHVSQEAELEEEMKKMIRSRGIRCDAYNAGCMYQDYRPMTLEEIVERNGG